MRVRDLIEMLAGFDPDALLYISVPEDEFGAELWESDVDFEPPRRDWAGAVEIIVHINPLASLRWHHDDEALPA